jgi:hypothetical protein
MALCCRSLSGGYDATNQVWRCSAYGLDVACLFALPGFTRATDAAGADVVIVRGRAPEPEGQVQVLWSTRLPDGKRFRCTRSRSGSLHFEYGAAARFALVDGQLVVEAWSDSPDWQRALLDSVLFCIPLASGRQALHASAVVLDGEALAIVASMGTGKTSLSAELQRRGHAFLTDDILVLHDGDAWVKSQPGPPLMNLPSVWLEALGPIVRPIAAFDEDDETWVEILRGSGSETPLRHVVLLQRAPHIRTGIELMPGNPLHLLPHAVYLDDGPRLATMRFTLFSLLATSARTYSLQGGDDGTPSRLADLVEQEVRR